MQKTSGGMKLWQKKVALDKQIEAFTVGEDRDLDLFLAKYDVYTNMAHSIMLYKQGFLEKDELQEIRLGLKEILEMIDSNQFTIEEQVEDIHSQIELMLTRSIGEAGKKVHLGRSRNDQVLTDLKLFFRDELRSMGSLISAIIKLFLDKSDQSKDLIMPGYTHSQIGMVSSFGLWFGAFAEALITDLDLLIQTIRMINKNPLGSAAGYGTSLAIDREFTGYMLGFDHLHINSIYAQMQRGKTEWLVSICLASIAQTINKISADICLFTSANYRLIRLPDAYTTGSSIMPHKKNPDVFELIRARCNQIVQVPQQIQNLSMNLMSGYHRDYQLLKEIVFPALRSMSDCLQMVKLVIPGMEVFGIDLTDEKYQFLSSVDEINRRVNQGAAFRDAYHKVSREIEEGRNEFEPTMETTHIGSIGNLGNVYIATQLEKLENQIDAYRWDERIDEMFTDQKYQP